MSHYWLTQFIKFLFLKKSRIFQSFKYIVVELKYSRHSPLTHINPKTWNCKIDNSATREINELWQLHCLNAYTVLVGCNSRFSHFIFWKLDGGGPDHNFRTFYVSNWSQRSFNYYILLTQAITKSVEMSFFCQSITTNDQVHTSCSLGWLSHFNKRHGDDGDGGGGYNSFFNANMCNDLK